MNDLMNTLMDIECKILDYEHKKRMITEEILNNAIKNKEFQFLKLDIAKIRRDWRNK